MIIREAIQTKVCAKYDVAVCGGGFGGISAALSAARMGKKVVLFEKQYLLGGLGTAGLVTIYLPLCDGLGHQVSFGIAEELLRLSIVNGAEDRYPDNWLSEGGSRTERDKRFEVQYNPHMFAILVEKLLLDSGVDIMYGTYVVGAKMQEDKIRYLITQSKSGREAYAVTSVVDATGDCDIAHAVGAPTEKFEQGNVLASWYYSLGKAGYKLHMLGFSDIPEEEKTAQNAPKLLVNRRFSGLDGRELSEMTCQSHASTYNDIMRKREADDTFVPVTIATIPQIRMTRKIVGEYQLSSKEMHKYFSTSIGMVSDWKKRGPVYEVPFETLYSSKVKNLICAGRCTCVDQTLWDVMRVIPCCAVTGQAAGCAAAMSDDFSSLDVSVLQKELVSRGVVLHFSDVCKD